MGALQDPKTGNSAEITNSRHLKTEAIAVEEATHISITHQDYYLVCNYAGQHSNANEWTLWMTNNSATQHCLIQNISISTNANINWHLGFGGAVSSYTSVAPIKNLNLSSSRTPPVTAYTGGVTFTTNPVRVTGGHMLANTKWAETFNGALVLGVNNSIGIYLNAVSAYVGVAIQFYMRDIE